jgi:hypothetical protein
MEAKGYVFMFAVQSRADDGVFYVISFCLLQLWALNTATIDLYTSSTSLSISPRNLVPHSFTVVIGIRLICRLLQASVWMLE